MDLPIHISVTKIAIGAILFLIIIGLRIAREYERGVIFRLGRYVGIRGPGLYWIIPFGIERSLIIDIRVRTIGAEQQETITRDSVTIKVNAVLWYKIVDASKSIIAVENAGTAVYQLALTSLRNIIGQHDLDEVLQERDKINALLRQGISPSTVAWGLEVERFEMKDVELPEAMQEVMAMQAQAIREKRARLIKADAELEASVKFEAGLGKYCRQSGCARAASHANGDRSGSGKQQHDCDHDSLRFRKPREKPRRLFPQA